MADQWYVSVNTPQGPQRQGPMPLEQVKQMVAPGQLTPQSLVWKEGTADWVPASSVPTIAATLPFTGPPSCGRPNRVSTRSTYARGASIANHSPRSFDAA